MKKIVKILGVKFLLSSLMVVSAQTSAFAFSFSFEWGNLHRCTSGSPNTVKSPEFALEEVPEGTSKIIFKLRDNNVPEFNHGGGSVVYDGGATVSEGAFHYLSPRPPDGSHVYTWTATALDAAGKKLGSAKAKKRYP